jgi:hypothetical protein
MVGLFGLPTIVDVEVEFGVLSETVVEIDAGRDLLLDCEARVFMLDPATSAEDSVFPCEVCKSAFVPSILVVLPSMLNYNALLVRCLIFKVSAPCLDTSVKQRLFSICQVREALVWDSTYRQKTISFCK